MPTMLPMWDGIEMFEATEEEALKLVQEDKAEIMIGNALKYRHEFTGYQTRELRAEPKAPVVEKEDKAANWEDYKAEAKKKLGLKRVTKKQVIDWMKDNGI